MANILSRVISGVRKFGLQKAFELIVVKIQSVLEPFLPRTIWGERIGLRSAKGPLTDAEVEQIYQWSRDDEVLVWSGGTRSELSLGEFRYQLRCERWRPRSNQQIFYIVTRANELVGQIGLLGIDWAKGDGELGILIGRNYWNKQFGREAVKLLVMHIFTSTPITRIHLGTFKDNVRAQRSFTASGFRLVGDVKRFLPSRGELVDSVEMEFLKEDFHP